MMIIDELRLKIRGKKGSMGSGSPNISFSPTNTRRTWLVGWAAVRVIITISSAPPFPEAHRPLVGLPGAVLGTEPSSVPGPQGQVNCLVLVQGGASGAGNLHSLGIGADAGT